MNTPMDRFEHEGLAITVTKAGRTASITWTGVSDSRSPGSFLTPVMQRVVEEVKGFDVTLDLSALEYMNSATVSPLINCIKSLDAGGTPVIVLFAQDDWQRTHLQCMRSIARTLTHVRVQGKGAA